MRPPRPRAQGGREQPHRHRRHRRGLGQRHRASPGPHRRKFPRRSRTTTSTKALRTWNGRAPRGGRGALGRRDGGPGRPAAEPVGQHEHLPGGAAPSAGCPHKNGPSAGLAPSGSRAESRRRIHPVKSGPPILVKSAPVVARVLAVAAKAAPSGARVAPSGARVAMGSVGDVIHGGCKLERPSVPTPQPPCTAEWRPPWIRPRWTRALRNMRRSATIFS